MLLTFLVAASLVFGCGGADPLHAFRRYPLNELERVPLSIGEHRFTVWVADTFSKRAEGMMFLTDADVKADEGMLFAFPDSQVLRFWMRNTYIPLDIAYIDSGRTIVKIHTMRPHDETTDYSSVRPAQFALEVKGGTFARLGIREGMRVEFPDSVRALPDRVRAR